MSKSIEFPGTVGNRYDYSINNNQDLTTALTILIVVKVINTTDNAWLSFVESETSGAAARPSIGRNNSTPGRVYYANGAVLSETASVTITDAENWCVVAVTKAAGTVAPRMHRCQIGGSNQHADGTVNAGDVGAYATGKFLVAGDDDPANIRVAAWAVWDGTALTDGQIEGIASAKTTDSILALTPTACFDAENSLMLNDLVQNMDGTLVGTITESSDGPTGWLYFGESAEPEVTFGGNQRRGLFGVM